GPRRRQDRDHLRRAERPDAHERPPEPGRPPARGAAADDGLVRRLSPATERDGGHARAARLRDLPPLERASMNRRDFFKIVATSGASAAVAGCQQTTESILPLVVPNEQLVPGAAAWFATGCRGG